MSLHTNSALPLTGEPVYDALGRIIQVKYNGTECYRYHYAADGRIGLEEDLINQKKWRYLYDDAGRLLQKSEESGVRYECSYDSYGELSRINLYMPGESIPYGEVFHVEKVELQHLNSPVSVYNIEVEDFHSYFVGDSGILVHNRNSWDPETTDTIRELLSGMGQLRNLQNNPNLKGVNINYLLSKTPGELMQMAKSGEITNKTLKQIKRLLRVEIWGRKEENANGRLS